MAMFSVAGPADRACAVSCIDTGWLLLYSLCIPIHSTTGGAMQRIYLLLCFIFLGLIPGTPSDLPGAMPDNKPSMMAEATHKLVQYTRVSAPLSLLGEPVPIHRPRIREALEKELLLTLWNRPQVLLWLKRSSRIFAVVMPLLKQAGLPEDLKYVMVVESALRPHAGSSKGAVGYWQFIRSTALKYDLQVDDCLDERRNLERSTRAACAYFKFLHQEFNTWALALAAYNMGENGLGAAMELQERQDYYDLYLSLETQRYVLKVMAVKMIFEHPERYGFFLEKEDYYPPEAVERVTFPVAKRVKLTLVAKAAGISFKELKILNPELRGYFLCSGPAELMVPHGKGKGFYARLKKIMAKWAQNSHPVYHVVEKGENLTMIATAHGVPLSAILQWNRLHYNSVIHPGKVLVVGYEKD